jgi:hypothetical protein
LYDYDLKQSIIVKINTSDFATDAGLSQKEERVQLVPIYFRKITAIETIL